MKILITGCTGFIGQNLMPMLQKLCLQTEMLTLNRNVEKAERMYPSNIYSNVKHTYADDWKQVQLFNPELVIHLAAFNTSRNDTEIVKSIISTNITYGILLLDALSHSQSLKLFINTGSFAEYRSGSKKFDSSSLYAASKTAFRSFVEYYSNLYGFKYITAVPYSVYGGKPTIKRVIDYIIDSIDAKETVGMSAGEQILDFVHVSDVANFYTYVVKYIDEFQRIPNGEEFYLGTGRGTSIKELVSLVEREFGKNCNIEWGALPYRDRDTMYAVAPIGRNLAFIPWKAQISLQDGIKLLKRLLKS